MNLVGDRTAKNFVSTKALRIHGPGDTAALGVLCLSGMM